MIRRIVVMLPNWIGDVVMATPAIRAIRLAYPNAEMIGVCRAYVREVLNGNPWLNETISLSDKNLACVIRDGLRFRHRNVDMAVLFPNSFRAAAIARIAGCRRRIGFDRYARGALLTDRLDHARGADGTWMPTPVLRDYNRLALKAGASAVSDRMELFTTAGDESAADRVWKRAGFEQDAEVACLNPGAAFGSAKLWPVEHFAALARRLALERSAKVLILCGPADREMARCIHEVAAASGIHTLAEEPVSIGLTKACVRRSALLISTDSGPRHFAAAFYKPVVALFGPTHIAWTQTFHPLERQLQIPVPCGPCQQRICDTDHRCMRELGPDDVYRAAIALLDQTRHANSPELAHAG